MFVFRNKNTGKFVTNQQKQYNYKTWKYIFHDNKKYDTLDPVKAVEVIQKFW